jgi:fatty acyl-CoA reductase
MSVPHSPLRTAAFVRVEEILLASSDVTGSLYMALNSPGPGRRLARLGALVCTLPALGALAVGDRRRGRRLAYLHYRGLSADRIELLSAEFYERFLEGKVREQGLEIVARARRDGHRVVLISSGLGDALRPMVDVVGADDLLGAELEMRDGLATGKLLETWSRHGLTAYAQANGINLRGSYGYGADASDVLLLREVGFPCVVNPDLSLRRTAETERWPVLEVTR